MQNCVPYRCRKRPSEEGYTLLMVIFLLAVLLLTLSVAVPKVTKAIQRDREEETMQRGKQYIRAIQLYYRKFGKYPPNIDALVKTNNIRFLRKKYKDPTTGKDEWKTIGYGQNKAPTVMGFFGQSLAGSTLAGIGTSGGNSVTGASSLGSSFMSSSTSATDTTSSTDSSGTSGTTSTSGTSTTSSTSTGFSLSSSSSSTGLTGQTFGGIGIIGVSPNSTRQSIMVYKKKNHYNEWEFVYDPIMEKLYTSGNAGALGTQATASSSSTSSSSSASSTSSSTDTQTTTTQP
jgi:type II secretory pathway pseudopilin PulG